MPKQPVLHLNLKREFFDKPTSEIQGKFGHVVPTRAMERLRSKSASHAPTDNAIRAVMFVTEW